MKKHSVPFFAALAAAALVFACSPSPKMGDPVADAAENGEMGGAVDGEYVAGDPGSSDFEGGEGSGSGGNSQAGRVTAGEWNDLDNWDFWCGLMNGQEYAGNNAYWGFWTNNRVAVSVKNSAGAPLAGIKVVLKKGDDAVWTAVTDNLGKAECWAGMFQLEEEVSGLRLLVSEQTADAKVTTWNSPNGVAVNEFVLDVASPVADKADIAFIVDATGSMGDEIQFLKDDLMDILKKVGQMQSGVAFRTAALFYRDTGDEYLTRADNFSDNWEQTVNFISRQDADGGDDWPEAVHTALEKGLQDLSWNESAKTRIAFMLLDAPAHHQDDIIASLQKSVKAYAAAGIKIIPISASGIDKGTEFMLRYFALGTGGTYVFITNDSGIGGEHIEASVGEYQVEQLNDLIVRLIKKYTD